MNKYDFFLKDVHQIAAFSRVLFRFSSRLRGHIFFWSLYPSNWKNTKLLEIKEMNKKYILFSEKKSNKIALFEVGLFI